MSVFPLRRVFYLVLAMAVMAGVVVVAACGGSDDAEETPTPAAVAPAATPAPAPTQAAATQRPSTPAPAASALSGTIAVAGSSTVFPISEAVAEEFSKANSGVRVNVASTGTGAGGRAMCEEGTIDVWNASRPSKESELEACAENGIELIELPVAFDALSVIVSPDNDWAPCLTVEQLKTIFGPDSEGEITNWNQVDAGFPDQRLRIYGPTTASGTFDYFTEAIMGEGGAHRGDLDLATEEDPLIANGVNGTPGGIGYFGLAYLEQYRELVEPVSVVNPASGECVSPGAETVESGTYLPLARPIFIYVNKGEMENRPELRAFVDFYLNEAPILVTDVGYVPLPADVYDWGRDKVENGESGSIFNTIEAGTPITEALERTAMTAPEPTMAPQNLDGTIAVAGSSTVFPISEAVAEEFSKANSGVRVNVASTGTGAGGRAMCEEGTIDVWNASRPSKESELEACAENGIELIELPVAFDALSVIVSPDNDWAPCLTVEQLKTIFGPDSEGEITNWNQVDAGFPDQRLRIYGPTTASGTFDYFTEAIMGEGGAHRGDLDLATEEDPLIANGVNGTPGGIGYFGLAYLEQYRELVEPVSVVNPASGECVSPGAETVESGTYLPLARPIFIYVNKGEMENRPELRAFVDFYLNEAPILVTDVGYVPLPADVYDWGRDKVENGEGGSIFNTIEAGTPITEALERVN